MLEVEHEGNEQGPKDAALGCQLQVGGGATVVVVVGGTGQLQDPFCPPYKAVGVEPFSQMGSTQFLIVVVSTTTLQPPAVDDKVINTGPTTQPDEVVIPLEFLQSYCL